MYIRVSEILKIADTKIRPQCRIVQPFFVPCVSQYVSPMGAPMVFYQDLFQTNSVLPSLICPKFHSANSYLTKVSFDIWPSTIQTNCIQPKFHSTKWHSTKCHSTTVSFDQVSFNHSFIPPSVLCPQCHSTTVSFDQMTFDQVSFDQVLPAQVGVGKRFHFVAGSKICLHNLEKVFRPPTGSKMGWKLGPSRFVRLWFVRTL
jgi:hypothetical protein